MQGMYAYGWWIWLLALPPAIGLAVWIWMSPTAHHLLQLVDPRYPAERSLVRRRLRAQIGADEYQRAMARVARHASRDPAMTAFAELTPHS